MRFVCDSCRAQYMISDDKVGASGVKVRCKKCGNVIVVRRPQDSGAEADAALRGLEESAPPAPTPEAPTGESSIFSDVDDAEIGAAFESALGERQDEPAPPEEEPPPPLETNLPPVSDGPPRALDWYVAIDEKQTGPLTPDAIKDYWDRGEIGPDSLTWRQGFEDWVALSEVAELAAWLAPRPQRPVFSPQSSSSGPMPVVPVPVESAFSAGGVMRTVRSEVPTPVPNAGGWKPSASAALASLVKEEIDALSKPDAPPPAPEPSAAPRSLLEVPPPTGEIPAASVNGRPARTGAPTPVTAVERPPTFAPAYPYATRPVKQAPGNKGVLIGIVVAVAVVLAAVGGGGWYLLQRQKATELAARQPPALPETPKVVTPPAQPPAAAQPAQAQTAQPASAQSVTPPVAPPVAKVTPAVPPGETSGPRRTGSRGSRSHAGGQKASAGGDEVASETPKSSGGKQSKADDLFDEVFGTGGSSAKSEDSRSSKKSAYVPPAPGSSSTEVPDRLPKGDIMSVVLANKPAIVRCVNEQKARDPNLHGTLVMHWVIQTSGKTTQVNAVTDQFKSSYMATCLGGLVKSWNFPKHKYQPGEPVDFPFTF
ncbi:MAG TPA: adventurous gliding motility protein GltJ [Myxococcaceae bacterium]|nr:adventurous gliding motility protein GltJ [Myxococcaceae bacterium]